MKQPLAHRSGLTLIGHMLAAYDVWSTLTKAQRAALEAGEGRPAVVQRLTSRGLWADGKPTLWAEFVMAARRKEGLDRWTVDDAGHLYRIEVVGDV